MRTILAMIMGTVALSAQVSGQEMPPHDGVSPRPQFTIPEKPYPGPVEPDATGGLNERGDAPVGPPDGEGVVRPDPMPFSGRQAVPPVPDPGTTPVLPPPAPRGNQSGDR